MPTATRAIDRLLILSAEGLVCGFTLALGYVLALLLLGALLV